MIVVVELRSISYTSYVSLVAESETPTIVTLVDYYEKNWSERPTPAMINIL